MKHLLLCLILTTFFADVYGQSFNDKTSKITRSSRKFSKKKFIKLWMEDEEVSWIRAYSEASQLRFVPINSFIISEQGSTYDSSQRITEYLIPNNQNMIEAALLIREGKFDGSLDCFGSVFYNDDSPCHIDPSKGGEENSVNAMWKHGYEFISKRNFSFLFSVKHIRNCWWFIEKGQIYLLDLEELKIYDPDEYIKQKCSDKIIRKIALNKPGHFICN